MTELIHRFRIEVSVKNYREAGAMCQTDLVRPVPDTMSISTWLNWDCAFVVYEGEHAGTPEDFAVIDRLMLVARP